LTTQRLLEAKPETSILLRRCCRILSKQSGQRTDLFVTQAESARVV
jgi:hypothetical protein